MSDPVVAAVITFIASMITLCFTLWNLRRIEDIKDEVGLKLQRVRTYDDKVLQAKITEIQRVNARALAEIQNTYALIQKETEQRRAEVYATDRELRNLRIVSYNILWGLFADLPKNKAAPYPSRNALVKLAKNLTNWYYTSGGMTLTAATRDVFFEVRDLLVVLAERHNTAQWSLDSTSYPHLFLIVSSLRTCLTTDTYSRTNAQLAADSEKDREEAEMNMLDGLRELNVQPTSDRLKARLAASAP